MQNTGPSPIVGVFRDRANADHAVEELKQAGLTDRPDYVQCCKSAFKTRRTNTRKFSYYRNNQG